MHINSTLRKSVKSERKRNKMEAVKVNEKGWNPQESYEKVNKTINEWPDWKKDAYNRMFAVSVHAQEVVVKR